jgi:hypothetical protein
MNAPDRYRVRIAYPTIGESRYFTHAGALSPRPSDAREFREKAKAERVARTMGSNATVEPVTEGAQ